MRLFFVTVLVWILHGCATSQTNQLMQQATEGDAEAQYKLARQYDNQNDMNKAFVWYRKSAELGYAPSQNAVGSMFQFGQGTTQDYKMAVEWYEKSSNQGNTEATGNLAYMYDEGLGV